MSSVDGKFDVAPTEPETTRMAGNFPHGSREAAESFVTHATDRSEKARCHTSDMHVFGESDSFIVPKEQANKDSGSLSAESVEGRGLTKENVTQLLLDRTQRRASRLRGLRISTGASRFGSNVSNCEAPPSRNSRMTEVVLVIIETGGHTGSDQKPPVGFIGRWIKHILANNPMSDLFQKHKWK